MKFVFIFFFFSVCTLSALSQQGNYWYFGARAGLNFNTSPPTALTNGRLDTQEGCAVISDKNGNLLFYTDGVTVWNRFHAVMPNGRDLAGNASSSHSAIIIPKPGSETKYLVVTADAANEPIFNGQKGYRYSEIDMDLDAGTGDVTAVKNVLLYAPSTEKLAATDHANGFDIWIVTKEKDNHVFRSYKVTCNGIEPIPVISIVDPKNNMLQGYKGGCFKISPDGSLIANARMNEHNSSWDLFRFDNATGEVSDRILFTDPSTHETYGVEFSPNSKIVYVNGLYTWQYKVDVYDSATIASSRYQVNTTMFSTKALQLGPDGKIYSNTAPNTSVITKPDVYGIGCEFNEQAISLNGRPGMSGFPTFFNRLVTGSRVDFSFTIQPDCRSVSFVGTAVMPGVLNWQWDFGDGHLGNGQNTIHGFDPGAGPLTVTLKVTSPLVCGSISISKEISLPVVKVFAGRDTAIVKYQSIQLNATGASNYTWSPAIGLNNPNIQNPVATLGMTDQTYYLVGTTSDGCVGFDTIKITVFDHADIYVPAGFTPNSDGKNDFLGPYCIGIKKLNYFRIYDRWGNIIFSGRNEFEKWDGTHKGVRLPTSNFVWMTEGVTYDGRILRRKGNVVIIR